MQLESLDAQVAKNPNNQILKINITNNSLDFMISKYF